MWHKLALTALFALVAIGPAPAQYPDRDRPPPVPEWVRRDRDRQDDHRRDRRHVWRYDVGNGGLFRQVWSGSWIEERNGYRDPLRYREVRRTPDFVELFDSTRNLYVRLTDNMLYQRPGGTDWVTGYPGYWTR
jgi:hypothetical protein